MATRRRRALRNAVQTTSRTRLPLTAQIAQAATSRTAKTLYIAVGTVGLAALGIAIFGPKRFNKQIVQPVRQAVGDQAEKIWADARPLRSQLSDLFNRAQSESGREKLVQSFQSWIGHFRAS